MSKDVVSVIYADYSYYVSGYLLGRSPAVPEEEFPFWEKQARMELDRYTFNRIQKNPGLLIDAVKDCCCELTELLYKADHLAKQAESQGGAGLLASFSNDGQSGSYDLSQSVYTESGKQKKVQEIIKRYLENTGLLYSGFYKSRC